MTVFGDAWREKQFTVIALKPYFCYTEFSYESLCLIPAPKSFEHVILRRTCLFCILTMRCAMKSQTFSGTKCPRFVRKRNKPSRSSNVNLLDYCYETLSKTHSMKIELSAVMFLENPKFKVERSTAIAW